MKRRARSAGAAKKGAEPKVPERKRGKSTGAIGRLVAQVQKTTLLKAKSDEAAISKVEESIKHRFMEGAEYFDKDNLVAELITEHKGNFKRIDLQLSAQHTIATRKLHQLVYHHSNGFLNLFREVHKAHDLVDSLKKEVHSMKTIIAALSKVTFSAPGSLNEKNRSQPSRYDDAHTGRRYRPSMMVDSGVIDRLLEVPSSPTQSLHCASYHLAAHVVRAPTATVLSKEADEIVEILMVRDVAVEEVRQLIGTLELTHASEWIRTLDREAEARGLEPVVLQLEQELAVAATKQLTRLPVTIAYFDALHLPLLELLVHLKRPQQATEWLLTLHSQCIASELRHLQGTTDGNELCLVATDLVVTLIKMTLRGLGRLGLPKDPNRPDAPFVNAQVILWVRREIESFGAGFLAQQILTTYRSNAGKGADQLAIITTTLSECVACVRRIEDIGFPHADVHLIQSMRDPLTQLLTEIGRRAYKKQSSISQALWNSVRIAVREDAKKFLGSGSVAAADGNDEVDTSVTKEAVAELAALNKLNMAQFDGLAASSHLSLLQLMCFPSSSHAFQVTSSHRLTSDSLHEVLTKGQQLDPYVWSKSAVVRKLLAEAALSKQLAVVAAHLTTSPITPVPRPIRLTLIESLASHRFGAANIRAALDQEAAERFQFLTFNSGGGSTSAASITPAFLNELLTRRDIATPYWSRVVRDVFSDALETTINQLLPAMKDVLQFLASHGGTNQVTQTQRKVMLSVLRNYRFVDSDIPEEFVENMDGKHLMWLFSSQCPLAHWSCTGPREFIADILGIIPQVPANWVQTLRSDERVGQDLRTAIQQQVRPMIESSCAIEEALKARSSLTLESVKNYLSPANAIAGQWPRVVRVVFALALEKKNVGHSGFVKVAELCKKLRDPIPIRVGVEDRKLVVASLTSKGDDLHLTAALSMVADLSPEDLDEQCALSCIASHHLTYLIDKRSSDIGVAYWSRATRDALADALERGHLLKPSAESLDMIKLLRTSALLTTRLSVDERRKIRDLLKRKVDSEPSASTREIAKQQWTRFTPAMVQRFALSSGASGAAGATSGAGGGGADPTSGAANYWCDVVRRCIRIVLERIIEYRRSLIDALRGPTRLAILKSDRAELSRLLEGYTFAVADIAKRAGSASSSGSGAKQLLTKAMVSHDDFPIVLSTTVGPSPLFHTTATVLFALHSSAKDNTQSRMGATIISNTNHGESLDVPPIPSALLQDMCLAEVLDNTCTGVCLAMMDVLRREVRSFTSFCSHRMIQEVFQQIGQSTQTSPQLSAPTTSMKGMSRYGVRDAPFVWVFHTLYAIYLDALALGVSVAFAQSPQSIEQRVGEASPLRVELLAQMRRDTLAPFIVELAEVLLRAAKEGPNCFTSSSSTAAHDILTARYNGGGSMPLTDVTAPSRMAGSIVPLEGYCSWRVVTTVPRYPQFDFGSVRQTDDEDYLFHYVVQISLNLLSMYQEVLFGDFDDVTTAASNLQQKRGATENLLLRRLNPTDCSIMQSWVVQRGSGTNHIAALSLLQYLVVSVLREMCSFGMKGNVMCAMYGDQVFSGITTTDAKALRQTLVCFAAFYYFWVPLFSSDRSSSLFASGNLGPESAVKGAALAPAATTKKGSAAAATGAAPAPPNGPATTSEVSRCHVDQTSAKASLADVVFPFGDYQAEASPDILRTILDECFSSTPSLEKYAAALHTDTMKSKLSKLFTSVNLLQFAAKNSLDGDDDDDDDEEDEEEDEEDDASPHRSTASAAATKTSPGSASGAPQASVTMAHLHELLIHYVRLVS
jgi:hypothetical protein